jgi:hypothetical protein
MEKKLTKHDIVISQKTRVLKFNHFHAIFSINKAKKCYPLFSERRKYILSTYNVLGARKLEKYWTNQTYQNYLEKGTALVSGSLTRKIIAINLESG